MAGATHQTYYFRDRNEQSNLAGGAPFCGSVKITTYAAQTQNTQQGRNGARSYTLPGSDLLQQTLEQVKVSVQAQKRQLVDDLMRDIDAWIEQFPGDLNQADWNRVSSARFVDIVNRYNDRIRNALTAEMRNGETQFGSATNALLEAITQGGWAEAGGWFQRLGTIRSALAETISSPPGDVNVPNYYALPADERQKLLAHSVTVGVSSVVNRGMENVAGAYMNARPQDLIESMPKGDGSTNVDQIRALMDEKLSTWSGTFTKSIIETATGANGAGATPFCGIAGEIGGSLNRMKCIGDAIVVARMGLMTVDVGVKTSVAIARAGEAVTTGLVSWLTSNAPGKVVNALWDWIINVFSPQLALLINQLEPIAFLFSIVLPSLPYFLFMMVVAGWLLAVLQTIIAAPLWVVMHMTPDRTFIGSQSQGYLLLLSLFVRPVLAVGGLYASMKISDPLIDYIANGFFAVRSAVETGMASVGGLGFFYQLGTFSWWLLAFGMLLVPVLYMVFGLPQLLPGEVLKWIGAGVSDLGETQAIGAIQSRMQGAGQMAKASSPMLGTRKSREPNGKGGEGKEGGESSSGGGGRSGGGNRLPGHGGQGVTPSQRDARG